MSDTDSSARITSILREFKVAMMISFSSENVPHGRPMAIATLEQPLGIWFLSRSGTEKIKEIKENPNVYITCQRDGESYLTLSGQARVVESTDKVRELWKEVFRVWFPDGPDSADISLVHFVPSEGEYWDESGLEGVRYVLQATKAYLTGEAPKISDEQHGHVTLR